MFTAGDNSSTIARALGWDEISLRAREIARGQTTLNATRGLVAGKPAVLFAQVSHRNGHDPIATAALYAYHSNVDWGIVADGHGITVFNSHRLVRDEWLTLPKIAWSELPSQANLLNAFTPSGILDGAIEEIAGAYAKPTTVLRPIDDNLVDRLDSWRDEALRYVRDAQGVDARLQTLYAQMFVLRAVEDRHLAPTVPPLSSVAVSHESVDADAWARLLSQARKVVGSNLFDQDPLPTIPPHVVAGVIHDLYHPGALPTSDSRYDFSWIEADVLGTAYEKYLSTVLHPVSAPAQADLFRNPARDVARVTVRKQSGTFYTPKFIHDYLAARTIEQFFLGKAATAIPRVIDFACGSGSFLVAAIDQLLPRLRAADPARKWAKEIVKGGYIAGIEVDPKTVEIARLRLWHRLVEEPDALPLPDLTEVIIQGDGLDTATWGALKRPYDIVLGNPPFLATSLVSKRDHLESTFETATGRYDFSSLFVEQALRVLEADGCYGLVVPNRLFINKSASPARDVILRASALQTIVDFGATQPFPDASAYVGCIVGQRRSPSSSLPDRVRVIEVWSVEPEYLAALLLKADHDDATMQGVLRSFQGRHPRAPTPWMLISASEMRSRLRVEEVAVRLETIAGIFQGIRTGGNDLFIFEGEAGDDHLSQVTNGVGETVILETSLLEPVNFGSEVDRYATPTEGRWLLYPYRNNTVLPESLIQERYPNTWAYLVRNRELLASRSSVIGSTRWYELIRQRDEAWLRQPKLLIRDLAIRTSFACDATGRTFIVGGTAVVPERRDMLLPLLAYLNSAPISTFVRRLTPQFRGNFVKFEPQHLQSVPVIFRLVDDEDFSNELSSYAKLAISARAEYDSTRLGEIDEKIDLLIRTELTSSGIDLEG